MAIDNTNAMRNFQEKSEVCTVDSWYFSSWVWTAEPWENSVFYLALYINSEPWPLGLIFYDRFYMLGLIIWTVA